MFPSFALCALGLSFTAHAAVIDMEGLPDTGLDTSSWTTGTAPPIADLVDLNDMQIAAKNTLSGDNYAYYRTGALDETSKPALKLQIGLPSLHWLTEIQPTTTICSYGKRCVSTASALLMYPYPIWRMLIFQSSFPKRKY